MNLSEGRELKNLYKEAFNRLESIPSWEKQRCIERMGHYLATERPISELKAYKSRDFKIQWKVCATMIINGRKPFESYKPEFVGVY
jgi:hypothetical protein